jgi:hypothetical protein
VIIKGRNLYSGKRRMNGWEVINFVQSIMCRGAEANVLEGSN